MSDSQQWIHKAAQYELLASTFIYTSHELVEALVCGEYSDAFTEISLLMGMDGLAKEQGEKLRGYIDKDKETVFHVLRKEYTRLFIGRKRSLAIPYAGVWRSASQHKESVLMIGAESMEIERFMRRCGIGQPQGTNEPLDHIASLLEFLQYLCLVKAGVIQPVHHAEIQDTDYELFYADHFAAFASAFAHSVTAHSCEPFFTCSAHMLLEFRP